MINISFQQVTEKDFATLHNRLKNDHLQGLYDGGNDLFDEFSSGMLVRIQNPYQFCYIFSIDNNKVGYIQCYDCCGLAKDVYEGLVDQGTRGVDMYIGDPDYMGRGIGTQVLQEFVKYIQLYHGAASVSIDPTPDNIRAIRSYQKAGFSVVQEFEIDGNKHLLMLCK